MNRKLRISLLGFVLLSLAGLLVIILVNYKGKPGQGVVSSLLKDSGVTLEKVRYSGYSGEDHGRREWELEAETVNHLKKEDLTVFTDVKVVFFSEDGSTYTLKGRDGTYSERKGLISVTGDVTMVTSGMESGTYRLSTESIEYSTRSKVLTSKDTVELKSRTMSVTGVGLKMDVEGGKLYILKDVRSVIGDDST